MNSATTVPPLADPRMQIDLVVIARSVWRQKLMIGAIAACCTVLTAIYAFSLTPQYQVSTLLRPVALNDLDELNRTKIYSLPPNEALRRVGASLESYETRLGYFRSSTDLQNSLKKEGWSIEQAFEQFNSKALRLVKPNLKDGAGLSDYIGLDMTYLEGLDGKSVLNGLVQYAIERERQIIGEDLAVMVRNRIRDLDAELEVARINYSSSKESKIAEYMEQDALKKAKLNDELKALRLQLKLRREHRVAELNEAISIATSLGLKRPSTPSSLGRSQGSANGNVITTEVTNQNIPLYFMGVDALEAEQRVLAKRTSDDFTDSRIAKIREELILLENNREVQLLKARDNDDLFLKGVDALRAERSRLGLIRTDMRDVRLVNVDRLAVDPLYPVSPNKVTLIVISAFVGLLIGVVVALLRWVFLRSPREFPYSSASR